MITTNLDVVAWIPSNQLTKRERQILALLVKGFTNQQIANRLGVKFYTVSSHLKNIYKKLGVHNRAGVVAKVLTEGLLDARAYSVPDRSGLVAP